LHFDFRKIEPPKNKGFLQIFDQTQAQSVQNELDISRYLVSKRPRVPDGTLYYSPSATVDVYELLRQFIDGTDEVDGLLVVVIAPIEFMNDERRGLNRYLALKLRISNEVQDQQMQNPLAALNRLSI
ncbi:MAG: hypothetical protein C4520_15700, partial [Candidatus Abyssobacteria bacterium SURF_5]